MHVHWAIVADSAVIFSNQNSPLDFATVFYLTTVPIETSSTLKSIHTRDFPNYRTLLIFLSTSLKSLPNVPDYS